MARLVFLLVAAGFIALGTSALFRAVLGRSAGGGMGLVTFTFTSIAITIGWFLARRQVSSTGASSVDPLAVPPGQAGGPAPFPSEVIAARARNPRVPPVWDFVLSAAVFWATILIANRLLGAESWSARSLLVYGGVAVGAALVLWYPFSPITLVAVTLAMAFPVAALFHLFFFFLGGSESILGYWLFACVMVGLFLVPPWLKLRTYRRRWERSGFPRVLVAAGLSVVYLIFLGFTSVTSGNEPAVSSTPSPLSPGEGSASVAAPASGPVTARPAPTVGAASREAAVARLLEAWRRHDEAAGFEVARPEVVRALWGRRYHPSARFTGCGPDDGGVIRCLITTYADVIVLTSEQSGAAGWFVELVTFEPPGYTVDPK